MRTAVVLLAALLAIPLAGCLGGPTGPMFAQWRLPTGSPAPIPVEDCDELLGVLNERALAESDTLLDQSVEGMRHHFRGGWGGFAVADVAESASADADGSTTDGQGGSAPASQDAEVTGTNNQESGVDEADLVKTDGQWTYVLQGSSLRILMSPDVGELIDHTRIEFENEHGGQLLLERRDPEDPSDDRLVVITRTWEHYDEDDSADLIYPHRSASYTRVRVLELEDRKDPAVVKDLRVEGDNVGARLVDGHAYIVMHARSRDLPIITSAWPTGNDLDDLGLDRRRYYDLSETAQQVIRESMADKARDHNRDVLQNASLRDHLPGIFEHYGRSFGARPIDEGTCDRFLVTEEATGRSVSTILSIHLQDEQVQDRVTQALGSHPIVYGAKDAIVLAAASRDMWWFWDRPEVDEATDLQWFDLEGLTVTPRASGRVPGIVQDSFGIDVHDDTLRVATTTGQWGRWWIDADEREPMMNHLVVLEPTAGELVAKGIVGGIAPGERIWSARFTDTRAYIITFEQIDPLWIIDLTDPADPRVLGELEIPGVSTYIHPLSDELLLTIGYGPGRDGLGLDRSRVQVSLFDISDESDPQRADLMELSPPDGWTRSGATREHKAFTYWDRLGMLAVPLSTTSHHGGSYNQHVGLKLVKVDTEQKELRPHGELDHDGLIDTDGHYYGGEIQRSYFLGLPDEGIVSVYAISPFGITAHDLFSLEEQSRVRFEGHPYYEVMME